VEQASGAGYTDLGGTRHVLAKGKANKKLAKDRLKELVDERRRCFYSMQ
jgi:hypothetical protein